MTAPALPDVVPDVDEGDQDQNRRSHIVCLCRPRAALCGYRVSGAGPGGGGKRHPSCQVCVRLFLDLWPCPFCGCTRIKPCPACEEARRRV